MSSRIDETTEKTDDFGCFGGSSPRGGTADATDLKSVQSNTSEPEKQAEISGAEVRGSAAGSESGWVVKAVNHPEYVKWFFSRYPLFTLAEIHTGPGIYFLIRDGRLIYIGKSRNVLSRVGDHASHKTFDEVLYAKLRSCHLMWAEIKLIQAFRPPLNIRVPVTASDINRLRAARARTSAPAPSLPERTVR